jgi:hypothetical protein
MRTLERGATPPVTLEQLTDDLRFLTLFERSDHVLKREALDRLLEDVIEVPAPQKHAAPVIPLRAPRERQ